MANLSAEEFIQKLTSDADFRSQVGITTTSMSIDEFQVKAAAAGYNYTPEEIAATAEARSGDTISDEDLEQVTGGFLTFTFKLVAVKTISWAHD